MRESPPKSSPPPRTGHAQGHRCRALVATTTTNVKQVTTAPQSPAGHATTAAWSRLWRRLEWPPSPPRLNSTTAARNPVPSEVTSSESLLLLVFLPCLLHVWCVCVLAVAVLRVCLLVMCVLVGLLLGALSGCWAADGLMLMLCCNICIMCVYSMKLQSYVLLYTDFVACCGWPADVATVLAREWVKWHTDTRNIQLWGLKKLMIIQSLRIWEEASMLQ